MCVQIKDGAGADGMGWRYGPDTGGAFGETGSGDGLTVAFSTHGDDRLKVILSGSELASVDVGNLRTSSWKEVQVVVTGSQVLVWINGAMKAMTNLPSWSPGSNWVMGFGARTGGDKDSHVVGQVNIDTNVHYKDWIGSAQG